MFETSEGFLERWLAAKGLKLVLSEPQGFKSQTVLFSKSSCREYRIKVRDKEDAVKTGVARVDLSNNKVDVLWD